VVNISLVSTIWDGMVTGFGTEWMAAVILFFALLVILMAMLQDFWAAFIFTSMPMVVFITAGLLTNVAIGYIALGLSIVFALIITRLFVK